jgi:hypothetical protein
MSKSKSFRCYLLEINFMNIDLLNGLKNKLNAVQKDAITTVIALVVGGMVIFQFATGLESLAPVFAALPPTLAADLVKVQVALVGIALYVSGGEAKEEDK